MLNLNNYVLNPINQTESDDYLHSSNNDMKAVIVFFNYSVYDVSAKSRFEFYGWRLKENEDWNGLFSNFSGFAGLFPMENMSAYTSEYPDININTDEVIEVQMNYASVQTQAANSSWYVNGYNGNTDSSIAVLDSGVNPDHDFLQGKIIGWQNFVDQGVISDNNGHGTFISSVISGTGTKKFDSSSPSIVKLYGNYSHLDFFDEYLPSKNYSVKIFSANVSETNSHIVINSTSEFQLNEIDKFWFELYYNSNLVNATSIQTPTQYYSIIHDITPTKSGIYDVYIKYHKKSNFIPEFSFNSSISYFPEVYVENYNHFTGTANATKIVAYKIVNQTGKGYVSDLISAMGSVILNRTAHHIVSVCLSIGTLGEDVSAINTVINEVIENHILVVIAAGNNGIEGSEPFNKLGNNKNAIVVGAINDKDQITSYSSMGGDVGDNNLKPDLVAPGGSALPGGRSIISADGKSDEATAAYGTSISTAIVSAAINLLIDAKWGTWTEWNNQDLSKLAKVLKAILLMTATETNLEREDDPQTDIDESNYSPSLYNGLLNSLKDEHEGYGRMNVQVAIDALTKSIEINQSIYEYLTSSEINPLGNHAFARMASLQEDIQYLFNLTDVDENADFDIFLFSNESNQFGEPILLGSGQKWYGDSDYIYFTPKLNQTNCIIIVKAIEGNSNFRLNVTTVLNEFIPELKVPEIIYLGGTKNDTVISLQEFYGNEPAKNYSIDSYWFYVEYFDNDSSNVPPQEVYVSIVETAKNYSLSQLLAFDNNYTNGAIFRSDLITFPVPGTYHYFFIASDGSHQVRYPTSELLNITIEFPSDSERFPYTHDFNEGYNGWTYNGTGWGLLTQNNQNDNRSYLYSGDWSAMYFGRDHNYPSNYTYQPYLITNPFPNGSLRSPLFNITQVNENTTQVFAKFGQRISINSGDFIYLQINPNWTGWITLKTYTDEERDWFLEEINITQYIGNYVQFRFLALVDDEYDPVQYKGLILDYFSLENYSNSESPEIDFSIEEGLSATRGFKYDSFTFSCRYYDSDGNYPEFVYLEMDDTNYSMINIFGDWNVSFNSIAERGIKFVKSFVLGEFSNLKFKFHVFDGTFLNSSSYYNQDNSLFDFEIPPYFEFNVNQSNKLIGYEFSSDNLSDYYIGGSPSQKELTPWLLGDNTWHKFSRFKRSYLYGGLGQSYGSLYQGYEPNWDIKLITRPLLIRDDYDVFLKFSYEISLQNEFFLDPDELDNCTISISKDFGESWIILKTYFYDGDNLSGNESIDLSQYSNEIILIMFTLSSNDLTIGLGHGWLLSNIYIGYDKSTDFIAPTIELLSPLNEDIVNSFTVVNAYISDDVELDNSRIFLYINNKLIASNSQDFNSEAGILTFQWDTTLYSNGQHQIKIVAFDIEGNRAEYSISVTVENGLIYLRTWGPFLIFIASVLIVVVSSYFFVRHRRKTKTERSRLKIINKDKVIKRIELIETQEGQVRPLILHCKYCKSWFESKDFNYLCPVCDHDQIYAAYHCINCQKWYFKDEPRDDYYCKNKKCEGVRLVKREKEEIVNILNKEGKLLRKYEIRNKKFSILDP
jgi:hypothetical protein